MEYIKLDNPEQVYVKKNLLHSEMEILSIIKRHQEYLKLRKLELNLKSSLRKKIKEVKEELAILDKALPKVKEESEVEKMAKDYPKKRKDLEQEIEEIQRKLAEFN